MVFHSGGEELWKSKMWKSSNQYQRDIIFSVNWSSSRVIIGWHFPPHSLLEQTDVILSNRTAEKYASTVCRRRDGKLTNDEPRRKDTVVYSSVVNVVWPVRVGGAFLPLLKAGDGGDGLDGALVESNGHSLDDDKKHFITTYNSSLVFFYEKN